LNRLVMRAIVWIHLRLGLGLTDPRTTIHSGFDVGPPSLDEKRVGNPYHALVALAAAATLIVAGLRGRRQARQALLYLGLVAATFILLSSMIKFSLFASRYHMAFFVLLAPAVGYEVGRWEKAWLAAAVALFLALTSTTILLRLEQRPLLVDRRGYSVVEAPRASLYFMTGHFLEQPYVSMAQAVRAAGCPSVGIMLSGDAAEYPLWPLLGEPAGPERLEWIVAGTPSARYSDASFQPCAVVCDSSCPAGLTEVRGLPLALDLAGFRLYLAPRP